MEETFKCDCETDVTLEECNDTAGHNTNGLAYKPAQCSRCGAEYSASMVAARMDPA
jgi:hypothetical protein